jgi:hypothetical protein
MNLMSPSVRTVKQVRLLSTYIVLSRPSVLEMTVRRTNATLLRAGSSSSGGICGQEEEIWRLERRVVAGCGPVYIQETAGLTLSTLLQAAACTRWGYFLYICRGRGEGGLASSLQLHFLLDEEIVQFYPFLFCLKANCFS